MDANYTSLDRVLRLAYEQSATGKGKDRHANSKAFDEQPIIEIARMVGAGFNTGQAMKKLQESMGFHRQNKHEAALAELLGAIVYTAAAYLVVEEAAQNEKDQYKLRIDEPKVIAAALPRGSGPCTLTTN